MGNKQGTTGYESVLFEDEDKDFSYTKVVSAREPAALFWGGKRDSCHHCTTRFNENVALAKTSYDVFHERGLLRSLKVIVNHGFVT